MSFLDSSPQSAVRLLGAVASARAGTDPVELFRLGTPMAMS